MTVYPGRAPGKIADVPHNEAVTRRRTPRVRARANPLRLFLRCMGNEYPSHREEKGNRGFVPSLDSWFFHESQKLSRHFSERERNYAIDFRSSWIRIKLLFLFLFFYGSMEIWIQKFRRNYTFRELWILEECKVLFKRNIVIFSRDWSHRITILLFFFVPGKG